MFEFPNLVQRFFMQTGQPQPNPMDIMFLMNMFDQDRNGRITFNEFRNMLLYMGGQRQGYGGF